MPFCLLNFFVWNLLLKDEASIVFVLIEVLLFDLERRVNVLDAFLLHEWCVFIIEYVSVFLESLLRIPARQDIDVLCSHCFSLLIDSEYWGCSIDATSDFHVMFTLFNDLWLLFVTFFINVYQTFEHYKIGFLNLLHFCFYLFTVWEIDSILKDALLS